MTDSAEIDSNGLDKRAEEIFDGEFLTFEEHANRRE